MRLLVERSDIDLNTKFRWGWTPLSVAAAAGCEAVVRQLIERNDVNINSKDWLGGHFSHGWQRMGIILLCGC